MRRRDFIAGLGSAAVWPLMAWAQQPTMPVIGFVSLGSADAFEQTGWRAAFRQGLGETGYVEGQNVTDWLEGQFDRLAALMADLVRRRVAIIATPDAITASIAAKAASATIPIVFGVVDDPVELGLVASLARPGGKATGVNWFTQEQNAKRLELMHELVPKAVRVGVLANPANSSPYEAALREVSGDGYSTPLRSPRSRRRLPALRESAPMPSSSHPTHSCSAAACKLPGWRRARRLRRPIRSVSMPQPAG
jgi:putative ABC transport system substrate-binding protein